MLKPFRYFKTNIIGGCRLSDLNMSLKQDEYFYLDSHISNISRSVTAALKADWIIEVSEKEAKRYIQAPSVSYSTTQITNFGINEKQLNEDLPKASITTITDNNELAQKRANLRIEKIKAMKKENINQIDVDTTVENLIDESKNPEISDRLKNRLNNIKHMKESQKKEENGFLNDEKIAKLTAEKVAQRIQQRREEARILREKHAKDIKENKQIIVNNNEEKVINENNEKIITFKEELEQKIKQKTEKKKKEIKIINDEAENKNEIKEENKEMEKTNEIKETKEKAKRKGRPKKKVKKENE